MNVRTALFITAGVIGAAVGGALLATALTDPDVDVGAAPTIGVDRATSAVTVGPASTDVDTVVGDVPDPGDAPSTTLVVQSVEGLEELSGTLIAGKDPDDWYVAGIEVEFGPEGWIVGAPAFDDYDGDGVIEPLLAELEGLDGRTVTLGVRYEIDDDPDDAEVFTIQGLAFRDPAGGPAPWQVPPPGVEASRDDVVAAALAAVGQGSTLGDVERISESGWSGWEVEVYAADGLEYEVVLDVSGKVVDVRPDDD